MFEPRMPTLHAKARRIGVATATMTLIVLLAGSVAGAFAAKPSNAIKPTDVTSSQPGHGGPHSSNPGHGGGHSTSRATASNRVTAGATSATRATAVGTSATRVTAGATSAILVTAEATSATRVTAGGTSATRVTAGGSPQQPGPWRGPPLIIRDFIA